MSGTVAAPGGQPQINPAALAAFAQMARGGAGGAPGLPQGMPQGGPMGAPQAGPMQGSPLPTAAPPAPPQSMAPIAAPGPMPGGAASMAPGQNLGRNVSLVNQQMGGRPMMPMGQVASMANMAQQGRLGDTMMAHMTPGEMAIPPQAQTPQVMAAVQNALRAFGASPQQFTAGSPAASVNPSTGQQQFSLWSAILPVLGTVAGSFFGNPEIGMAIGGGLGGLAGGLVDKSGLSASLLQGLGGAAGGALGGAMSGVGSAGAGAAGAGASAGSAAAPGLSSGVLDGSLSSSGAGAIAPAATNAIPTGNSGIMGALGQYGPALKAGMMSGMGASLGGALAPQQTQGPQYPPGFTTPMAPLNRNFGQLMGSNVSNTPNFSNYNPYASVTGQPQTFFPVR